MYLLVTLFLTLNSKQELDLLVDLSVDWLQSLKQFFINVSYHILVASLTMMLDHILLASLTLVALFYRATRVRLA